MKRMNEIRAACANAGCHFFERETMRFFNSRVESNYAPEINRDGSTAYRFITSEQFDDEAPRLFTVREVHLTAEHRHATVGEFQQHKTKDDAKAALLGDAQ